MPAQFWLLKQILVCTTLTSPKMPAQFDSTIRKYCLHNCDSIFSLHSFDATNKLVCTTLTPQTKNLRSCDFKKMTAQFWFHIFCLHSLDSTKTCLSAQFWLHIVWSTQFLTSWNVHVCTALIPPKTCLHSFDSTKEKEDHLGSVWSLPRATGSFWRVHVGSNSRWMTSLVFGWISCLSWSLLGDHLGTLWSLPRATWRPFGGSIWEQIKMSDLSWYLMDPTSLLEPTWGN